MDYNMRLFNSRIFEFDVYNNGELIFKLSTSQLSNLSRRDGETYLTIKCDDIDVYLEESILNGTYDFIRLEIRGRSVESTRYKSNNIMKIDIDRAYLYDYKSRLGFSTIDPEITFVIPAKHGERNIEMTLVEVEPDDE